MSLTQKIVLIALLVLAGVFLVVALALTHHIGGFLRTVEEETSERDRADGNRAAPSAEKDDAVEQKNA